MEITSRKQSKDLGIARYFTGKPCKRGHVCQRFTSSCMCVDCLNERNKTEYWKDPELHRAKAIKKYSKEKASVYYIDNKYRIDDRNAEWRSLNPSKVKSISENYRKDNKEKVSAATKLWASKNRDKLRIKDNRRRSLLIGADGTHTVKDIIHILERQLFECVYCMKSLNEGYHVDHIMPLSLGGSNWPSNLQCLCPACNIKKGARHPDDWHKYIGYAPSMC